MYQQHFSEDDSEDDLAEEAYEEDQEIGPHSHTQPPGTHSRRYRYWFLLFGILTIAILIISIIAIQQWQSASDVMPTYLELDHRLVAKIEISPTEKQSLLLVNISLYDRTQHQTDDTIQCYITQGDTVTFQGAILHFAESLNNLGLHSGYKLIKIQGCYNDANNRDPNASLYPNNGADAFFIGLQNHPWIFSTATANAMSFALKSQPLQSHHKGETYVIYTSPDGLHAVLLHSAP
jgi:hypothetical protein